MEFVSNIIQNSVAGFVDSGMRTAGGYAGDWLNKAGDFIEGAGTSYGNSVAGKFDNWGNSLSGSKSQSPSKPLPRTKTISNAASSVRPKAIQRSNSTPVLSKTPKTTSTIAKKGPVPAAVKAMSAHAGNTKKTISPASRPGNGLKASSAVAGTKTLSKGVGEVKYTPGVVTGMAKSATGAVTKKKEDSNKQPSGNVNYTPGVLTGVNKPLTTKPIAPAGPKAAASKKPGSSEATKGQTKYTPGVVTGMPKRVPVNV